MTIKTALRLWQREGVIVNPGRQWEVFFYAGGARDETHDDRLGDHPPQSPYSHTATLQDDALQFRSSDFTPLRGRVVLTHRVPILQEGTKKKKQPMRQCATSHAKEDLNTIRVALGSASKNKPKVPLTSPWDFQNGF